MLPYCYFTPFKRSFLWFASSIFPFSLFAVTAALVAQPFASVPFTWPFFKQEFWDLSAPFEPWWTPLLEPFWVVNTLWPIVSIPCFKNGFFTSLVASLCSGYCAVQVVTVFVSSVPFLTQAQVKHAVIRISCDFLFNRQKLGQYVL